MRFCKNETIILSYCILWDLDTKLYVVFAHFVNTRRADVWLLKVAWCCSIVIVFLSIYCSPFKFVERRRSYCLWSVCSDAMQLFFLLYFAYCSCYKNFVSYCYSFPLLLNSSSHIFSCYNSCWRFLVLRRITTVVNYYISTLVVHLLFHFS